MNGIRIVCVRETSICALSLMYSYVAVCRFCAVRRVIIICLSLLFSNYSTYVFLIFSVCFCVVFAVFVLSCVLFLFCVVCFVFLCMSTYHFHRVETQLQYIIIIIIIIINSRRCPHRATENPQIRFYFGTILRA